MIEHVVTVFYDERARNSPWQIVVKWDDGRTSIAQGLPIPRCNDIKEAKRMAERLINIKKVKWEDGVNPVTHMPYARCVFKKKRALV